MILSGNQLSIYDCKNSREQSRCHRYHKPQSCIHSGLKHNNYPTSRYYSDNWFIELHFPFIDYRINETRPER